MNRRSSLSSRSNLFCSSDLLDFEQQFPREVVDFVPLSSHLFAFFGVTLSHLQLSSSFHGICCEKFQLLLYISKEITSMQQKMVEIENSSPKSLPPPSADSNQAKKKRNLPGMPGKMKFDFTFFLMEKLNQN